MSEHYERYNAMYSLAGTDYISRHAAIDVLNSFDVLDGHTDKEEIKERIEQLPPAQPKRGKWILKSYRWECDQCGCLIRRANPFKGNEWNYNYCPNCGADMREETE